MAEKHKSKYKKPENTKLFRLAKKKHDTILQDATNKETLQNITKLYTTLHNLTNPYNTLQKLTTLLLLFSTNRTQLLHNLTQLYKT
jgi:hypothetical protein